MPKENGISLRKFKSSDLSALKKLINGTIRISYPNFYPKEAIKFFLDYHNNKNILKDSKEGYTIVLRRNNRIIGTGTIIKDHILRVFVNPEFQRQGLGKVIMQKLEAMAVSNKTKVVELDASLPSKKFCDSLGYKTSKKTFVNVDNGEKLHYYKMKKLLIKTRSRN